MSSTAHHSLSSTSAPCFSLPLFRVWFERCQNQHRIIASDFSPCLIFSGYGVSEHPVWVVETRCCRPNSRMSSISQLVANKAPLRWTLDEMWFHAGWARPGFRTAPGQRLGAQTSLSLFSQGCRLLVRCTAIETRNTLYTRGGLRSEQVVACGLSCFLVLLFVCLVAAVQLDPCSLALLQPAHSRNAVATVNRTTTQ